MTEPTKVPVYPEQPVLPVDSSQLESARREEENATDRWLNSSTSFSVKTEDRLKLPVKEVSEKEATVTAELLQPEVVPSNEQTLFLVNSDNLKELDPIVKEAARIKVAEAAYSTLIRLSAKGLPLSGLRVGSGKDIRKQKDFMEKLRNFKQETKVGNIPSMKTALVALAAPDIPSEWRNTIADGMEWGIRNSEIKDGKTLLEYIRLKEEEYHKLLGTTSPITEADVRDGITESEMKTIEKLIGESVRSQFGSFEFFKKTTLLMAKKYADASLMHPVDEEAYTKLFTDLKEESWNKVKDILTLDLDGKGANTPVARNLSKNMEKAFGKDWRAKLGLWMARQFLVAQSTRVILPGAADYTFKVPVDDRMFWSQLAVGTLEMQAFLSSEAASQSAADYWNNRDAKFIEKQKEAMYLNMSLAHNGMGPLGIAGFNLLSKVFGPKIKSLFNNLEDTARASVKASRKKYADYLDYDALEQLAVGTDDPLLSRKFTIIHDNNIWGKGGPLSNVTESTAPVKGPLNGAAKEMNAAGLVSTDENTQALVHSVQPSSVVSAVEKAVANKQEVFSSHMEDGVMYMGPTDKRVPYKTPKETVKALKEKDIEGLSAAQLKGKAPGEIRTSTGGFFTSPTEMGDDAVRELIRTETVISKSNIGATKEFIGELHDIYRQGGYFADSNWGFLSGDIPGVRRIKKPVKWNNWEAARQAQNDLQEWLPYEELQKEFHFTDKQIAAERRYRRFIKKFHAREDAVAVAEMRRNGTKVVPHDFGDGYERIANIVSPKNAANMTDEQLMRNSLVAKAVRQWEERQTILDAPFDEMLVDVHPLERLRRGDVLVVPWDAAAGAPSVINGKTLMMYGRDELRDPSNVVPFYKGYFPVSYTNYRHYLVEYNRGAADKIASASPGASNPFTYHYGFRNVNDAKKALGQLPKNEGSDYFVVSVDSAGKGASVHSPLEFLTDKPMMRADKLNSFLQELTSKVNLTDDQITALHEQLTTVALTPNLRHRGEQGLKGGVVTGRRRFYRDPSGRINSFNDPEAAPTKISLKALEERLHQFEFEHTGGRYRKELVSAYEKEFSPYIKELNGEKRWVNGVMDYKEFSDKTGLVGKHHQMNIAKAKAYEGIINSMYHTITPTERAFQRKMWDWAWGNADKAMEGKQSLFWDMLGTAAEELGDIRSNITVLKTNAGAQFFLLSARAYTQQLVQSFTALSINPQFAPIVLNDTTGVLSTFIPGIKHGTKKLKRYSIIREELDSSGFVKDLNKMTDMPWGEGALADFGYSTVMAGEATARVTAFSAARAEAKSQWKRALAGKNLKADRGPVKWSEAKEWFDGDRLTDKGLQHVLNRAQDMALDFRRIDAPGISRGISGALFQFISQPVVKVLEQQVYGSKFTPGEKARMALTQLVTWGPSGVIMFGDALGVISKTHDFISNAVNGKTDTAPTTLKEALTKDQVYLADFISDQVGGDKKETKEFIFHLLRGGLVDAAAGSEVQWSVHNRMWMGFVMSESLDYYGSGMIPIPSISAPQRAVEGFQEAAEMTWEIMKQKGFMGLGNDVRHMYGEPPDKFLARATDIARLRAAKGFTGISNIMKTLYLMGFNSEGEQKYLDTAGNTIENLDEVGFGDYLKAITGYGEGYKEAYFDLNDITVGEMRWLKERGYDIVDMYKVSPQKAEEMRNDAYSTLEGEGKGHLIKDLNQIITSGQRYTTLPAKEREALKRMKMRGSNPLFNLP